MEKKIYLNFRYVGIKFDIINHPDPLKKVPDPAGQKSPDPDPHPCVFLQNIFFVLVADFTLFSKLS